MKEVLDVIVYLCFIISIVFTLFLGLKSRVKEVKKTKEELRKEGKLATPKQSLMNSVKVLGGMFGISIIISIMVFYIFKTKFLISPFLGMVLVVFMFECAIGTLWGFVKHIIEIHKEEGTIGTIIILTIFIILEVSYLYIKDFKGFR